MTWLRFLVVSIVAATVALLMFLALVLTSSDAFADSYAFTQGSAKWISPTLRCVDIVSGYTTMINFYYQASANPERRAAAACSGTHDGVVGHTITMNYTDMSLFTPGSATATLAAIYAEVEPESSVTPDLARRISSYPIGEVIVMCACFGLAALGFRTGYAP